MFEGTDVSVQAVFRSPPRRRVRQGHFTRARALAA
jgi:hypothetical protein